jgi:alpha-L-fucosidase
MINILVKVFFGFIFFFNCFLLQAQETNQEIVSLSQIPQLTETKEQNIERMSWFRDAKLGMFIHWGPCTVGKKEIGWGREANRPWDNTPSRQGLRSEDSVYDNYYKSFNPIDYNPTEWVKTAKKAGVKYMVLITKHHDGFSMFDTKYSDYNIMNSPYRKDIIKEFVDACHKENMKIGLYYSTRDWYHPDYLVGDNKKYDQFYRNQIKELLSNYGKIDIMWFDHVGGQDWTKWRMDSLFAMMYQLQPNLIINNRAALFIGNANAAIPKKGPVIPEIKTMTAGDYYTPEGRIGSMDTKKDWESCIHIGQGWSYRGEEYFTPINDCITMLVSCATGGGNLLLNFDPTALGDFPTQEKMIAKYMGVFTSKYSKAIYGTRGGPFTNGVWGGSTHNGNKIYLFVKSWDENQIKLSPLSIKILKVNLLAGGKNVDFTQTEKQISIKVPKDLRDSLYTVLELTSDSIVSDSLIVGSRSSVFSDEAIFGKSVNSGAIISLSSKHPKLNNDRHNIAFLNSNSLSTDYSICTSEETNPFVVISLSTMKKVTGISIINKPGLISEAVFKVQASKDSTNWETVYTGKYNKDYWELPINDFQSGAQVPGKFFKYFKIEAISRKPILLQLRKAEVFGKDN